MPTYIEQPGASDVSIAAVFDRVRILGTDTVPTADVSFTIPANTTQNFYFVTPQGTPNSSSWEAAGVWSAEWHVITTGTNLSSRCRVGRVNRFGTIIDIGTFTAFQNLTAATILTFAPVAPIWATDEEDCGNRIVVQIQVRNTNLTNNRTCVIRFGDTDAQVVTDVTENSAACRRIFIA